MGEMTIRNLDESLMIELEQTTARQGVPVGELAADPLRSSLRPQARGRAAGARAIIAAQPNVSDSDSAGLIREDRATR